MRKSLALPDHADVKIAGGGGSMRQTGITFGKDNSTFRKDGFAFAKAKFAFRKDDSA
jgi:hypothetical protein